MTSNVGSDLIRRENNIGLNTRRDEAKTAEDQYSRMKDKVLNEMKNVFRPEFLNRIDTTVVFHALSKEHIGQIVDLMIRDVTKNVTQKGVTLEVTEAARSWLGDKGYDPVFGARPLRRVIQNEVEDRLSESFLLGEFGPGDTVEIDMSEDSLVLRTRAAVVTV
jgi:ATP-dependent Clp protease ATP-binding subunit ClpC